MAHRKSAIKRIRSDEKKRDTNRRRKAILRTIVKKAETAIAEGNAELAQELCRQANSHLDRAAQRKVIKRGAANRKKSRLTYRLNALTAA